MVNRPEPHDLATPNRRGKREDVPADKDTRGRRAALKQINDPGLDHGVLVDLTARSRAVNGHDQAR